MPSAHKRPSVRERRGERRREGVAAMWPLRINRISKLKKKRIKASILHLSWVLISALRRCVFLFAVQRRVVEGRLFADKLDTAYIQRVVFFRSSCHFRRFLETARGQTVNGKNLFWFQPLSSSEVQLPQSQRM